MKVVEDLKSWVKRAKAEFDPVPEKIMSEEKFFRDPYRARIMDKNLVYSAADGVLLYLDRVSTDGVIGIKGKYHKLRDIVVENLPEKDYWVAGVFMTYYDPHINRMPTDGLVSFRSFPPILTYNQPMLATENDLLKSVVNFKYSGYEIYNARFVNRIYCPIRDVIYYIVQIADDEVNTICPFSTKQNDFFPQNCRFSAIRWGSQVDLIIPGSKVKPLLKAGIHVEAGVDALFEVI